MNKKRERTFVVMSVVFLVLIVSTTWIYMLVSSIFMQKAKLVESARTEEKNKSDMIGRIQSANRDKMNQEEKNSMISNIIN